MNAIQFQGRGDQYGEEGLVDSLDLEVKDRRV